MSIDAKLRKAAKRAKAGDRSGAAALYREVLAAFPQNVTARKGLAALQAGAADKQRRTGRTGPAGGAGAPPADAPPPQIMRQLDAMLARGQARPALAEAQKLALRFPRAAGVQNLIGLAHGRLGQPEAAIRAYDRVLALDPKFAGAHVNKANAYALLGQHDKSETEARAALALDARLGHAHLLLGYALVNTGRSDEAIASFKTAVRLAPEMVQTHLGLGNAWFTLGKHEAALEAFLKAYALDPTNAHVLNNLGNTYNFLKKIDEAADFLGRAVAREPNNLAARNNYVRVLRDLGRAQEGADICEGTLARDENNVVAWGLLGGCRQALGDFPGAIEAIDRAVALDPDDLEALALRWDIDTLPLDHPDRARIEAAIADETRPLANRATLEMDLFKAFDKAGDTDTAARHLHHAKALRREAVPYDLDAHVRMLEKLIDVFKAGVTPLDAADMAEIPAPARPVFIVGMPRSGTSLVEQILASHSQVAGLGELDALTGAMMALDWRPGAEPRPLDRAALREIRRSYLDEVTRRKPGKPVFTDKAPLNFRFVGPALAALPEARVLFMERDARATCWSNYSKAFKGKANSFGEDMRDTARMYRFHLRLRDFWMGLFPDRVQVVPYERLTEHQEEESRRLVAAAGLDWEPACLEFYKTRRSVRTASAGQVRQKMYTGSSEAWRRYAPHIAPMLEALDGL